MALELRLHFLEVIQAPEDLGPFPAERFVFHADFQLTLENQGQEAAEDVAANGFIALLGRFCVAGDARERMQQIGAADDAENVLPVEKVPVVSGAGTRSRPSSTPRRTPSPSAACSSTWPISCPSG